MVKYKKKNFLFDDAIPIPRNRHEAPGGQLSKNGPGVGKKWTRGLKKWTGGLRGKIKNYGGMGYLVIIVMQIITDRFEGSCTKVKNLRKNQKKNWC